MRYISIEELKPGMISSGSIYDYNGQQIIGGKIELKQEDIKVIREYGYSGIYIDDELSKDIKVEDIITPALRARGLSCVRTRDIDGCKRVAREIVDTILARPNISIDIKDLRSYDNFTYSHSVNVAVYSCVIGIGLHFSEEELEKLVMAALLHDIGKLSIPEEIINKNGRLTQEEFDLMRKHPVLSYELIADNPGISKDVKRAVLSHHENEDGSGYPSGIKGDDLSVFAKILHVADVYDALVSERPYKKPYSAYEAAEYMMGGSGILFNQKIVEALIDYVPLYPKGTGIVLSDGRKGIIVENDGYHNLRPIIRTMDGKTVDLTKKGNLALTIVNAKRIREEELLKTEAKRDEMIDESNKELLMIVDNNTSNINMLGIMLESRYKIVAFTNGRDAINYILEKKKPKLILLDLVMPIISGEEVAEEINEMCNFSIPIMFMGREANERMKFAAEEAKAVGLITRPFNTTYIKREISKIIDGER